MRPLIYKDGKKPVQVTAENKKYPKKSIFGYCKDHAACRAEEAETFHDMLKAYITVRKGDIY